MIREATALRVRPEVWKFCSMFIISVMVFTLVTVLSQENSQNLGSITGAAAEEPLPGEEGSHPGFAACQSLPENIQMETVFNCDEADYQHCADVIGAVFEFSPDTEEMVPPCRLTLPPEEAGYKGNAFMRELISCADPNTITLAKYDFNENTWKPIESEVTVAGEGYKVSATVQSLGSYAVIKKTGEYFNPLEETLCYNFACLSDLPETKYTTTLFSASYTTPTNRQVKAGNAIDLHTCGMIKGCIALPDDGPNKMCPPGIDPDGLKECTSDTGNCCIPARDGICDNDCWKDPVILEDGSTLTTIDENGATVAVAKDSTDPDCLEIGKQDVLANIQHSPQELEPVVIDHSRSDNDVWQLVEYNFDTPKVVSGDITFTVDSDLAPGYAWFKDFAYIDINNNEHKLFPQWQLGRDWLTAVDDGITNNFCQDCSGRLNDKGENRPKAGYGPEPRNDNLNDKYEQIEEFDDGFWNDNDYDTDKSYWEYLFFHPYVWYQSSRLSREVFTFPNITMKGIKFYATKDESNPEISVRVSVDYYDVDSDPDKDGFGAETDCRDNNPSIKPMKNEPAGCDGIDNNCNKELFIKNDIENAAKYGTPVEWKGKLDDNLFWDNHHKLAPCDGYVEILDSNGIAYLELWELEEYLPGSANERLSYTLAPSQMQQEGEKWYPVKPLWDGQLWMRYQKVFRNYDKTDLEIESNEGGPPSACGESGDEIDNRYCIVGSRDSCNINSETATDCSGASTDKGAWQRYGKDLNAIFSGNQIHPNYDKPKINIKSGDVIWGAVLPRTDDDVFQHGEQNGYLKFQIWCYPKIEPTQEEEKFYIDEGLDCSQQPEEQKTVYFCSYEDFDNENRRCYDGTNLCQFHSSTDGGSCNYLTNAEQKGSAIEYYAYACSDDTSQSCYKYTKDILRVCAEKESCDPATNLDMDCDGLKPYATNEDGTADTSRPLDSDCIGACIEDSCNPVNKKWCNLGQWDESNYCQKCGSKDSTCGQVCEPGERSCDGGCLPNACDVSDNKWCNSGYWDTTDYATKCGKNDSEYYVQANNDCTHRNGCDVNAHKKCFQDRNLWSWGFGDIGTPYCDTACSLVDSSCDKPCTSGTCDVEAEKYCNNGIWTTPDNYCDQCGAVDSDCGVDICQEGTCDYGAHKVCINKLWTQPADYCAKCAQYEVNTGYCACTQTPGQEEVETSCTDNLDNDCDGVKDCADPDCPSDLPECSCIDGSTQTCGADIGLCNSGSQTCSNGAWGTCIGETKPKTEVCNSFDDDCDGETDEGCGSCMAGEKRQCGVERGLCSGGLQSCSETTGLWSTCSGPVYQTVAQEDCDGMDNNCNGQIDEGCACVEGSNQTCGINVGICKPGIQTCTSGVWSDCLGMKDKLPEVCNDGLDNDCDGLIDNADDACSASASLVPTCYDAIQNQGEDELDCGGPCPDCNDVSCNDRQKNGDEEGLDCGGSYCPPCNGEIQKTECGDGDCNGYEDSDTCPDDCPPVAVKPIPKSSKGFPFVSVILIILFLGIVGVIVLTFLKSKKTGQSMPEILKNRFKKKDQSVSKSAFPSKPSQRQVFQQPQMQRPALKQKKISLEEDQLEKSFKEASDLFKK